MAVILIAMTMSRFDDFLSCRLKSPVIMGVVNVTPDSFSDAGQFQIGTTISHAAAAEHALTLAGQGAAILDIGGEASSFHRPGIVPIDPDEQLRRILPVIDEISRRRAAHAAALQNVLISVDTRSSKVAAAALRAGADMINDISAGTDDPEMLALAAAMQCPIVLMHRREEHPQQLPPVYEDVCQEVFAYLQQRSDMALAAGVKKNRILLDPGLGFGKSRADNWRLLAGIGQLTASGFVVVLGASRKRFLAELLPPDQQNANHDGWLARDIITSQIMVPAAEKGVMIHRVHNVPLARQALEVFARMS